MTTTCWLIGATHDLPAQAVTIAGSGQTIAADDYYLYHATASISLLAQFAAKMTAAGVGSAAAFLTLGRRVRLTGGGVFTVTWGDLELRNQLGFTANLSGASAYTSDVQPPLLWSPGRPESPSAPLGETGLRVWDTDYGVSGGRVVTATTHNQWRENKLTWRYVEKARVLTSTRATEQLYGGLFEKCLRRGYNVRLYRAIEEVDGSTTDATASLSSTLGPYVMRPPRADVREEYEREIKMVDSRCAVELDLVECSEIV